MKIGHTEILVVRGSVLEQDVDVIVNAANTAMRGGSGVDGAIHNAAGPELLAELERVAPQGATTGSAVITSGHRLRQKWIIHTPGPVWRGGNQLEPFLLANCYRESLIAAEAKKLSSIAFCSISTGIYGYPLELAAPLAMDVVVKHVQGQEDTSLDKIVFAMYTEHEHSVFAEVLSTSEPGPGRG